MKTSTVTRKWGPVGVLLWRLPPTVLLPARGCLLVEYRDRLIFKHSWGY